MYERAVTSPVIRTLRAKLVISRQFEKSTVSKPALAAVPIAIRM
jgi:hypothetical protein